MWKIILGCEKYEISSEGNIRNIASGLVLKPRTDHDGYYRIGLYTNKSPHKQKNFKIARLVALNFIPNPKNKPEVNHKNGNKADDTIANLEWVTASENCLHAFRTGLKKPNERDKTKSSKLSTAQVLQIKKRYDMGVTQSELAIEYGVSQGGVSSAILSVSPADLFVPGNGEIQKQRNKLRPSLTGEFKVGAPKITKEQAIKMKEKYDQGYTQSEIANDFGLTQSGVSGAIRSLSGCRKIRRTSADALPKDVTIERGNATVQRARHVLRKALLDSLRTKSA